MKLSVLIGCCLASLLVGLVSGTLPAKVKNQMNTGLTAAKGLSDFIHAKDFVSTLTKLTGSIGPFLGAIGPLVSFILGFFGIGESAELAFLKQLAKHIDDRFDHVDDEFAKIARKIDYVHTQVIFGTVESNIHTVCTSLQQLYDAPLGAVNGSKRHFIKTYDQNYNGAAQKLYDGVMLDNNVFFVNLGTAAMQYSENSRKDVQTFLLGILKLLIQAVHSEMAYLTATGETTTTINYHRSIWTNNIAQLKVKMQLIDQTVAGRYLMQAEKDLDIIARSGAQLNNNDFTNNLYVFLSMKYFWRDWMVLVYKDISGFDKHCVRACWGFVKFRYYGRNLIIASVDKTSPSVFSARNTEISQVKAYTNHIHTTHTHHYTNIARTAEQMFMTFSMAARTLCLPYASIGVVRTGNDQHYLGHPGRFTLVTKGLYTVHIFG